MRTFSWVRKVSAFCIVGVGLAWPSSFVLRWALVPHEVQNYWAGRPVFDGPVTEAYAVSIQKEINDEIQRRDVISRFSRANPWPVVVFVRLIGFLADPIDDLMVVVFGLFGVFVVEKALHATRRPRDIPGNFGAEKATSGMRVPQYVTRFYGTTEFALDVLESRRIAFIHTSLLNDPFDPYCFFETDFDDSYAKLIQYVKQHHPADTGWFRTHVTALSWATTVKALKAHIDLIRQTAFVLSTSAASENLHPRENLYMWGHYGHGHRGVAIEFDTAALEKAVLAQHAVLNGEPFAHGDVWAQMEYTRGFQPISAEDVYDFMKQEKAVMDGRVTTRAVTRLDRYYSRMSTVKSDVWRIENEWRLMWRSDETTETIYKCPIDRDCIAAIYLGLSLPQEVENRVISAARSGFPTAKIMKASKRHGDLALDFREI